MTDGETKMRDIVSKIGHLHIEIRYSERKIKDLVSKIRDLTLKMTPYVRIVFASI
jgi:hypothetical protein